MGNDRILRAIAGRYIVNRLYEIAEDRSREWDGRQRQWRLSMEEKRERLIKTHSQMTEQLVRLDTNLMQLQTRHNASKDSDFQLKIRGWLAETLTKRQQLGKKLDGIRQSVADVDRKLNEGSKEPAYYQGNSGWRFSVIGRKTVTATPPSPVIKLVPVGSIDKPGGTRRAATASLKTPFEKKPVTHDESPRARKPAVKKVAEIKPAPKASAAKAAEKEIPAKKPVLGQSKLADKALGKQAALPKKVVATKPAPKTASLNKPTIKTSSQKVPGSKAPAAKRADSKLVVTKVAVKKTAAKKTAIKSGRRSE